MSLGCPLSSIPYLAGVGVSPHHGRQEAYRGCPQHATVPSGDAANNSLIIQMCYCVVGERLPVGVTVSLSVPTQH